MSNPQVTPNTDRDRHWAISFLRKFEGQPETASDAKALLVNILKSPNILETDAFAAIETITSNTSLATGICERQSHRIDEEKLANFVRTATTWQTNRLAGFRQSDADKLSLDLGVRAQKRLATFREAMNRLEKSEKWSQAEMELLAATLRLAIAEPRDRMSIRSEEIKRVIDLGLAPKSSRQLKMKIESVLQGSVEVAEPLFHCLENLTNGSGDSDFFVTSPLKANSLSSVPYSPTFGKSYTFAQIVDSTILSLGWILPIILLFIAAYAISGVSGKKGKRLRKSPSVQREKLQRDFGSIVRNALIEDDDKAAEMLMALHLLLAKGIDKSATEAALKKSRALVKKMKQQWRDEGKDEGEVHQLATDFVEKTFGQSRSKGIPENAASAPISEKNSP